MWQWCRLWEWEQYPELKMETVGPAQNEMLKEVERRLDEWAATGNPGEQYTIYPETWHWFQAGEDGAIISEFSTRSTDETDTFTDKKLVREVKIED